MAPRPEQQPATPARSGAHVQPDVGDLDHPAEEVPASWLTEHAADAEHIDRLTADVDLITTLALRHFQGPQYDYFAHELAKYGIAVIGGWLRRGLIFARCRERGIGGLPPPPDGSFDDPDVVAQLALETVAVALVHFRTDVLVPRRWDHRRGASLRTFFIGQCLLRFANVYRYWLKHESTSRRDRDLADHDSLEQLEQRRVPSADELVSDQLRVDRALRAVSSPRVREVLVLHAVGVPHAEIGLRLGVTAKAVERMIANEKTRLARRGIA